VRGIISYLSKNQFITALLIIALTWFLVSIREILVVLFISFILMTALIPVVNFLKKKGLSHALSVAVTYVAVILCIILIILPLAPFFIQQIQSLTKNFPNLFESATEVLGIKVDYSNVNSSIANFFQTIGKNVISISGRVFGGVLSTLTVVVVSFYLLLYHERLERLVVSLTPTARKEQAKQVFLKIEEKMGNWVRGQLALSFFIGVITWVFLSVLGVSYALPLAFLAGFLEILPTIGPVIASIPAIIVALTISPTLALSVAIGYIVIQAIENNVLVPKIMQAAVGLNPVVIIIAILIGGNLLGVWGALLSIPFLTVLTIIFRALSEE
jgi:predicted PurR-regulated permease PerM